MGEYSRENKTEGEKEQLREKKNSGGKQEKRGMGKNNAKDFLYEFKYSFMYNTVHELASFK
jgi:hypothetical protein